MGEVTRYRKKVFLGHFRTTTDHSLAYLETYTVSDKLEVVFSFYKLKNMRRVLPSSSRNHGNNWGPVANLKSK